MLHIIISKFTNQNKKSKHIQNSVSEYSSLISQFKKIIARKQHSVFSIKSTQVVMYSGSFEYQIDTLFQKSLSKSPAPEYHRINTRSLDSLKGAMFIFSHKKQHVLKVSILSTYYQVQYIVYILLKNLLNRDLVYGTCRSYDPTK